MTTTRKRIYVCSPLSPRCGRSSEFFVGLTRKLCAYATKIGVAPFAPHIFYTQFLEDAKEERVAGMDAAEAWLCAADEVWLYKEFGVSEGMWGEIACAARLRIPVKTFPDVPRVFLGEHAPVTAFRAAAPA